MTTLVVWTGTKCIGIFRHQLSIVSGEFYLAQHFLETIVGATLGVGGGVQTECIWGIQKLRMLQEQCT